MDDAEDLYRAIRSGRNEYTLVEGKVIFSSSAFDDRNLMPSVDRSAFRADPAQAKKEQTDGVAKLITLEVRQSCKINIVNDKGEPTGSYAVDAIHRPIARSEDEEQNNAHCQIECAPQIANASRFKKLKEALAILATAHGFVVEPSPQPA